MAEDFARLTLTRNQQRLLDTSTAIRSTPPDRIDFLHTVQCQCGIPYKNPGDDVREWDRKQGNATLHIEAGSAIDPKTGDFVKLGLPYGEKPRLVLIHLATEAVRTGNPIVDVEESMTAFARSLGIDCAAMRFIAVKSAVHFRSGFERIAGSIHNVNARAIHTHDFTKLPRKKRNKDVFPVEIAPKQR